MRGGGCLGHAVSTPAAGILRANGHDDPQLRGHDIQPLGAVFADAVHLAAATWTKQAVRLNQPLNAGQAFRKMPEVAAGGPARGPAGRSLRILPGLGLGHSRFQILEGQLALAVAQLLGALAMQNLVQFGNEMLQPPVCFPQRIPFVQHGQHSCTLAFGDNGQVDGWDCGHIAIIA